ncbi:hypothetical protein [Roseospira navarrensis]|uniref:Uncharacterized protein n=1 Tax=Roseospira navarrensis TaxID=140058 RepID=A0A7X1ZED6_9PROT|nr:hypothetical protein [Roseospira navarrensis]MQX37004.1 hypothetical protein [Roseospira navarrensis]
MSDTPCEGGPPVPLDDLDKQFLLEQYRTLREEIKAIKHRIFGLTSGTAIIVPTLNFFSVQRDYIVILIPLPFIIAALALNYMAERNAVIRAGYFIAHHVETRFPQVPGWERWLEAEAKNREVGRWEKIGFLSLFVILYLLAAATSLQTIWESRMSFLSLENIRTTLCAALAILYLYVGYRVAGFFSRGIKISTTTW